MRRSRLIRWIEYHLYYHTQDFPARLLEVGNRALTRNNKLADTLREDLEHIKLDHPQMNREELQALTQLQNIASSFKGRRTYARRLLSGT